MTSIHRWTVALAAIASAGWVGCGGGSSSRSKDPADAGALCRQLIDALADQLAACHGGTKMPPEATLPQILDCGTFQEAQDADRSTFRGADAGACVAAVRAWSCAELDVAWNFDAFDVFSILPSACQEAMAPAVELGGDCASVNGIECIDGYCPMRSGPECITGAKCTAYLQPGDGCGPGDRCAPGYGCDTTCVAEPAITILGAGGNCAPDDTTCGDGLYCASGTCAPKKAVGDPCSVDEPCLEALRCVSDECVAPVQAGAACAGGDCAQGLYCNPHNVCAPQPKLGEDCTDPSSHDVVWCVDSWCDSKALPSPTCEPYFEPGGTCVRRSTAECGTGYQCLDVGLGTGAGVCGRYYCPPIG
jgi:hypothetical protein